MALFNDVFNFELEHIKQIHSNMLVGLRGGAMGVIDFDDNIVIPFEYHNMMIFDDQYILVFTYQDLFSFIMKKVKKY